MKLTDKGKKTIRNLAFLVILIGGVFGLRYAATHGIGRTIIQSFTADKIALNDTDAPTLAGTAKSFAGLPSNDLAGATGAPEIRINFWAWNSQMGCLYANGGARTTKGSLAEKHGVRVNISRQDDNSQLMAQLTALADAMADGENDPKDGIHFVGIMGDGAHAFLSNLNAKLVKDFGPEYQAEIVGSCGYSRGEDAVWGPEAWRTDPQSMKGGTVIGVLRDGDINIAIRYAADNGVAINPDEQTYDPNALNFINSESYTKAAQDFVAGACQDRRVVVDGKATGETKKVCADAVATWTPGDVTVAENKGGVVRVISTAPDEYANQMPHVLIGIRKWNRSHRSQVESLLAAFLEGGDQVLTYPQALDRAAEITQEINQESGWTAADWKKYYLGTQIKDRMGKTVVVGGSKANNLNDNLVLFGLADGTSPASSRMRATYTVFGQLVHDMYPDHVPTPPSLDSVIDLSYLKVVAARIGDESGQAESVTYTQSDTVSHVIGNRSVAINFATGSATLTPAGEAQLERLFNELSINNLRVVVSGHTDNTGDPEKNLILSEARANAVKAWLERRSPTTFPAGRVSAQGFGDSKPVGSNSTNSGRAQNRRVEILIGS